MTYSDAIKVFYSIPMVLVMIHPCQKRQRWKTPHLPGYTKPLVSSTLKQYFESATSRCTHWGIWVFLGRKALGAQRFFPFFGLKKTKDFLIARPGAKTMWFFIFFWGFYTPWSLTAQAPEKLIESHKGKDGVFQSSNFSGGNVVKLRECKSFQTSRKIWLVLHHHQHLEIFPISFLGESNPLRNQNILWGQIRKSSVQFGPQWGISILIYTVVPSKSWWKFEEAENLFGGKS